MLLYLAIWVPVLLTVGLYLCSWPQLATWRQVLCFDGSALLGFVAACWLAFRLATNHQTSVEALNEWREWQIWLIPFWSSVLALPWFLGAGISRYFLFRSTPKARNFNQSLSGEPSMSPR